MTNILKQQKLKHERDINFIKNEMEEMEHFMDYFIKEYRFDYLMQAHDLLISLSSEPEPDQYLLILYHSDIRFRVIYDRLFRFNRNRAKRRIANKLFELSINPIEKRLLLNNKAYAHELLDLYKTVFGKEIYKSIFKTELKLYFTTKRINQWLI